MSGYPAESALKNGAIGPNDQLIGKPFKKSDLARALREALD